MWYVTWILLHAFRTTKFADKYFYVCLWMSFFVWKSTNLVFEFSKNQQINWFTGCKLEHFFHIVLHWKFVKNKANVYCNSVDLFTNVHFTIPWVRDKHWNAVNPSLAASARTHYMVEIYNVPLFVLSNITPNSKYLWVLFTFYLFIFKSTQFWKLGCLWSVVEIYNKFHYRVQFKILGSVHVYTRAS